MNIDWSSIFSAGFGAIMASIGCYAAIRADLANLQARLLNVEKDLDRHDSFFDRMIYARTQRRATEPSGPGGL